MTDPLTASRCRALAVIQNVNALSAEQRRGTMSTGTVSYYRALARCALFMADVLELEAPRRGHWTDDASAQFGVEVRSALANALAIPPESAP